MHLQRRTLQPSFTFRHLEYLYLLRVFNALFAELKLNPAIYLGGLEKNAMEVISITKPLPAEYEIFQRQ